MIICGIEIQCPTLYWFKYNRKVCRILSANINYVVIQYKKDEVKEQITFIDCAKGLTKTIEHEPLWRTSAMPVTYAALDIESRNLRAAIDPTIEVFTLGVYTPNYQECILWSDTDKIESIKSKVESGEIIPIFHNAAFDKAVLELRGWKIDKFEDTMCMSYVLCPGEVSLHSLNTLSYELLNRHKLEISIDFDDIDISNPEHVQELSKYNLIDCELTYLIWKKLNHVLHKDNTLFEYYEYIEKPYINLIISMQINGIDIDVPRFDALTDEYEGYRDEQLVELQKVTPPFFDKLVENSRNLLVHRVVKSKKTNQQRILYTSRISEGVYTHCSLVPFNPNSPAHKTKLLKIHGIQTTKTTPSGKKSTDKYVLQDAALVHPVFEQINKYIKVDKFYTSFLKSIYERIDEERPTLYGSMNQFNTNTRRLSSSNPNLQNIPSRDERGALIRRCFVHRPGKRLLVGDLDRIEVVVLSFFIEVYTGDSFLADRIRNNEDVHAANMIDWGTDDRKRTKNGLFALIYGAGKAKFMNTVGVASHKADVIWDKVYESYAAMFELRDILVEEAIKNDGKLYDWFGGLVYVPEIMSSNKQIHSEGIRKVFNYMIQGTAGTIFKILQLRANRVIHPSTQLLLVVHDESIYETDVNIAEEQARILTNIYTNNDLLSYNDISVPISATFNVGDNWYDTKAD